MTSLFSSFSLLFPLAANPPSLSPPLLYSPPASPSYHPLTYFFHRCLLSSHVLTCHFCLSLCSLPITFFPLSHSPDCAEEKKKADCGINDPFSPQIPIRPPIHSFAHLSCLLRSINLSILPARNCFWCSFISDLWLRPVTIHPVCS